MCDLKAYRQYQRQIESSRVIVARTKKELYEAVSLKQQQYLDYRIKIARERNDSVFFVVGMQHVKTMDNQNGALQYENITIGLTPTMGALHDGHKSLMEANVAQNHIAIVSIFVNPTQFGPSEDLAKYPRTFEQDMQMCQNIGVDIIFAPTSEVIYEEDDEITLNPPKKMGYILEGFHRPTHFSGVLQVVLKLFHLMAPTRAYFGQKDAQQLLIVQKMVQQLCLPIEIIGMPIVRDFDRLALSSRNIYLSKEDRKKALAIPATIFHLQSLILEQGVTDIGELKQEAKKILKDLEVDYMDFYNHDLTFADEARNCIFLLVARVANVRLLDNLWIK